jgi:hypothetical protein
MKRHLLGCPRYLRTKHRVDSESTITDPAIESYFSSANRRNRPVMTADRIKDKIVRIIISGNLPFSFVENVEFVDLVKDAYPNCDMITRKTVVDYLRSKATCTKEDISMRMSENKSKVSLAMDIWTTRTHLAFLGMYLLNLRMMFS